MTLNSKQKFSFQAPGPDLTFDFYSSLNRLHSIRFGFVFYSYVRVNSAPTTFAYNGMFCGILACGELDLDTSLALMGVLKNVHCFLGLDGIADASMAL